MVISKKTVHGLHREGGLGGVDVPMYVKGKVLLCELTYAKQYAKEHL